MATEKRINTRIQLKIDTTANWTTASEAGFVPKKGEPIIYKDSGVAPRIKIGDGSTVVGNLDFFGEDDGASGILATESSSGNVVIANLASSTTVAETSEF